MQPVDVMIVVQFLEVAGVGQGDLLAADLRREGRVVARAQAPEHEVVIAVEEIAFAAHVDRHLDLDVGRALVVGRVVQQTVVATLVEADLSLLDRFVRQQAVVAQLLRADAEELGSRHRQPHFRIPERRAARGAAQGFDGRGRLVASDAPRRGFRRPRRQSAAVEEQEPEALIPAADQSRPRLRRQGRLRELRVRHEAHAPGAARQRPHRAALAIHLHRAHGVRHDPPAAPPAGLAERHRGRAGHGHRRQGKVLLHGLRDALQRQPLARRRGDLAREDLVALRITLEHRHRLDHQLPRRRRLPALAHHLEHGAHAGRHEQESPVARHAWLRRQAGGRVALQEGLPPRLAIRPRRRGAPVDGGDVEGKAQFLRRVDLDVQGGVRRTRSVGAAQGGHQHRAHAKKAGAE